MSAAYSTHNFSENTIPLDFEVATDDSIQAGDIVLTCYGWWACVNYSKTNSRGVIGYSVSMLYQTYNHATGETRWLAPRNTSRIWVWDCDVEAVLPR